MSTDVTGARQSSRLWGNGACCRNRRTAWKSSTGPICRPLPSGEPFELQSFLLHFSAEKNLQSVMYSDPTFHEFICKRRRRSNDSQHLASLIVMRDAEVIVLAVS